MTVPSALPEAIARELEQLADKACSETITHEESDRLNALLRTWPEAAVHYLDYMGVHARMGSEFGELAKPPTHGSPWQSVDPSVESPSAVCGAAAAACPALPKPAKRSHHRSPRSRLAIGAATVSALVLLAAIVFFVGRPIAGNNAEAYARLTGEFSARWNEQPRASDDEGIPPPTRFHLEAGMAEITFAGGAVVLLEGPGDLEAIGPSQCLLYSGQAVVRAGGEAIGFVLQTHSTSVVDTGTEFGVKQGPRQDTEVLVFEGSVVAQLKDSAPDSVKRRQVSEGQAVRIDADSAKAWTTMDFQPTRYVRRLPDPVRHRPSLRPYNQSRIDSVYVVPTRQQVVIDGELGEWDRGRPIAAHCEPPYAEDYRFEGWMMYDREFLYVAAHVRDPSPLRNVIDPRTDGEWGWRGGGIQIRLSTDRVRGWPLDAENRALYEGQRPARPEDANPRLAHLTFGYFQPRQENCLDIAYGMNFDEHVSNPPGYLGAFRKDGDRRGYTMEYAIPWSLLHASDDPPQAGDVLAATWIVHWSDESGRLWLGNVIEGLNPRYRDATTWTFLRAATWGRAVYLGDSQ